MRDKYAEALNRQDLERLREAMRVREVSNNTINHYQAYIQAALAWGLEQELIFRHPWHGYKKLKVVKPIVSANFEDLMQVFQFLPEYLQWAVKTAFFWLCDLDTSSCLGCCGRRLTGSVDKSLFVRGKAGV